MDANRFDTLTRLIAFRASRRVALGLAATGLFAIAVPEAEAVRCSASRPCPECYRCRRRRCRKRANDYPCTSGTCQDGNCVAGPTCSDNAKNGSETDIDCGGSCPPCATGKACLVGGDCVSGNCQGQLCQPTCGERACSSDSTCASFGCGTCNQGSGRCRNP
jgi:hypothetical protein